MRRTLLACACACAAGCGGGGGANQLPDAPPAIDAAPSCAPSTIVATHQGAIAASETWATGVHRVTGSVTVTAGTLTIAPCTEIRLAANASITIAATATALIAEGSEAEPIRFVRDAAAQPWGRIQATAPARLSLAHATLIGGGTAGDYRTAEELGAMIEARGAAATLPTVLGVDHVTVDGASGIAVFMNAARFTAASTALTITRAGFHPILLGADTATELPAGAYTGNTADSILLQSAGTAAAFEQARPIVADTVLHDRGVPYQVGVLPTAITVGSNVATDPPATLTIEAGATLAFVPEAGSTSRLQVRQPAALVVAGTATSPVTFTSAAAAPAAGDWQGIEFRGFLSPASHITHAVIDYAGGPSFAIGVCEWQAGSGNRAQLAAVIISVPDDEHPNADMIGSTAIDHSAGAGIYRGWTTTDVDLITGNTFNDVAGCLETNVPNAQNACPATSCPTL